MAYQDTFSSHLIPTRGINTDLTSPMSYQTSKCHHNSHGIPRYLFLTYTLTWNIKTSHIKFFTRMSIGMPTQLSSKISIPLIRDTKTHTATIIEAISVLRSKTDELYCSDLKQWPPFVHLWQFSNQLHYVTVSSTTYPRKRFTRIETVETETIKLTVVTSIDKRQTSIQQQYWVWHATYE